MKTYNTPFIKELRKQALEKKIPFSVCFELTGRCNLNCKMCYVHVLDDVASKQLELSTDQWKRIMDEAIDAGMMYALLTGGECLIRPDFKDLFLYLYNRGVKVRVNTNALLLNDDYISFFLKHQPEHIQATLYGSCDDVYEAVTGKRVFHQVSKNLFALRDSGLEYDIACTPNRFSYEDYRKLLRFLLDNKLNVVYANDIALVNVREAENRQPFELTQEEVVTLNRIRCEEFGKKLYSYTDVPKPCGDCMQPIQYGSPCKAGRSSCAVTWKGMLQPCIIFDEIGCSVLENSFSKAWGKIKNDCAEIAQPLECQGCTYEKFCKLCPVLRFDGLHSGHCNKQMCEFAVKMAQAGLVKLPSKP